MLLCRGIGIDGPHGFFEPQSTAQQLAVYGISGVIAVGLALPALLAGGRRGWIPRLLTWPTLVWLGSVSYGIYLYHVPILVALNGGTHFTGDRARQFAWVLPATLALAVVAAALSFYLVERPAMRLLRRTVEAGGRARTQRAGRPSVEVRAT